MVYLHLFRLIIEYANTLMRLRDLLYARRHEVICRTKTETAVIYKAAAESTLRLSGDAQG